MFQGLLFSWICHSLSKLLCSMSKISIFFSLQYDGLIVQLHNRSTNQYKDADEITKESRMRLSNSLAKICYCLEDTGLLCASEVLDWF